MSKSSLSEKVREAMIARSRGAIIRTWEILDCCDPVVQELVQGSSNMDAALRKFWDMVRKHADPDEVFNRPETTRHATWTIRTGDETE